MYKNMLNSVAEPHHIEKALALGRKKSVAPALCPNLLLLENKINYKTIKKKMRLRNPGSIETMLSRKIFSIFN
jgi:hypothetical protein